MLLPRSLTSTFTDPSGICGRPFLVHLLRVRETWGLVTAKFLSDAAWYFYLSGCQNICTTHAGSISKQSGPSPGFLRGIRSRLSARWRVFELPGSPQVLAGRRAQACARLSAALMPWVILVPQPVSSALRSSASHISASNHGRRWSWFFPRIFSSKCRRRGRRTGRFRRRDGRNCVRRVAGYLLDHGFGYSVVFRIAGTFHVVAFLIILACHSRHSAYWN